LTPTTARRRSGSRRPSGCETPHRLSRKPAAIDPRRRDHNQQRETVGWPPAPTARPRCRPARGDLRRRFPAFYRTNNGAFPGEAGRAIPLLRRRTTPRTCSQPPIPPGAAIHLYLRDAPRRGRVRPRLPVIFSWHLGIPLKAPAAPPRARIAPSGLADSRRPSLPRQHRCGSRALPLARVAAATSLQVAGIASSARGVAVWQIHINRQRY